ncbi:MAG: PaaI family thioesterase [Euzebya sp.]
MTTPSQDPLQVCTTGFDHHLGLELTQATPQRVVARLKVTDHVRQPYGLVHGGVYASMAETVASVGAVLAIRELTGSPDSGSVGQSNHTDFLKAVRQGTLTATATPVHTGRSVQLWQVDITDDEGAMAAQAKVRMFNVGVTRMEQSQD